MGKGKKKLISILQLHACTILPLSCNSLLCPKSIQNVIYEYIIYRVVVVNRRVGLNMSGLKMNKYKIDNFVILSYLIWIKMDFTHILPIYHE